MKALNHLLGVKSNVSTAYHPQTDGQTEHLNQEIKQYPRALSIIDKTTGLSGCRSLNSATMTKSIQVLAKHHFT
jgi:hypothetical protein